MPLLAASAISKSYPGVRALAEVSLALEPGTVHALVGENGAGKSTLSRILAGIAQPDAGVLTLRGQPFAPASRRQAELAGVRIVMQELNLIPTLSVAENIFLDQLPRRLGFIAYRRLHAAAQGLLSRIGLPELDPARPVASLGVGQQQMVEIARGLAGGGGRTDVFILDEPTASLTTREIELLFEQIRQLKASGAAIVYISHRMEEIRQISDRITILRDGRLVGTFDTPELSTPAIIRHMVGRDIGDLHPRTAAPGPVALRVRNLFSGKAVRDVSFDLHRGEILGLAGLVGSGRTETLRAIFGADRADSGQIFLHDRPAAIRSPHDAVAQRLAFLTEDRKGQGLLLPWSITENATLTDLPRLSLARCFRRPGAERAAATELSDRLAIRARDIHQAVGELSGGNQQKVVVAKWLFREADILLFDEPTRGIDVGAKFELYRLLSDLAAAGKAILVVSSDLLELLALADRIAVMSAGRLVATFPREQFDQEAIMAAALSGYAHA